MKEFWDHVRIHVLFRGRKSGRAKEGSYFAVICTRPNLPLKCS